MSETKTLPVPDFKKLAKNTFTWQTAFMVLAGGSVATFGWNYYMTSGQTYMMSDGSFDIMAIITTKLQTYGPLALSILFGYIATWLGVTPEFVKAAQDLAKNPNVEEIERRFIGAAVGALKPLLGKYPEILINLLKSATSAFDGNPEVQTAINALGRALVDHFFAVTKTDEPPVPTVVVLPPLASEKK